MALHVPIPASTYVDLYAASGISVGTPILVKFIGGGEVKLFSQAAQPTEQKDYDILDSSSEPLANTSSDLGAWAYSIGIKSIVSVEVL